MSSNQNVTPVQLPPVKEDAGRKQSFGICAEFLLVLTVSVCVFSTHLFCLNSPNITLVFDSRGYLAIVESWLRIANPEFICKVGQYVVHGCSPVERAALAHYMGSASEILKSGPLLPIILGIAYAATHTPPDCAHWQVGALAMILIQSLSVSMIWSLARSQWGIAAGRVAAVIALSYSGMVLNAGRLMSEIPAAFAVIFNCFVMVSLCRAECQSKESPLTARKQFLNGGLFGFSLVLLMLARSALILLPLVVIPGLVLLARSRKIKLFAEPRFIAGAAVSIGIFLSPWILCEQILTGHPGVLIDRYGAYNLFTGCDVRNDGFDVLPSQCVSHPEQFKASTSDAVKMIIANAAKQPADFVSLMLRKPARLIDSPWNDFQVPCWGMPWILQTWWHQLLILFAAAGFLRSTSAAISARRLEKQIPPVVLTTVIGYHLITCAFITMRRYMVTAMPAVIVLAAVGMVMTYRELPRKRFLLFVSATCALAALLCSVTFFSEAQHQLLPIMASAIGIEPVCLLVTATLAVAIFAWFRMCVRSVSDVSGGWLRLTWLGLAAVVAIFCSAATVHDLHSMEYNYALCGAHPTLQVQIPAQNIADADAGCYLLADIHGSGAIPFSPSSLSVYVNGRKANADFQPLLSIDQTQRENMLYERVFAACGGAEPENLRQWWLTEIPSSLVGGRKSGPIKVELSDADRHQPVFVGADFYSPGRRNHELSIRRFSWSKGFSINPAGEMRMGEIAADDNVIPVATDRNTKGQLLRPRVYLLVVDKDSSTRQSLGSHGPAIVPLPDAHIRLAAAQRLVEYRISPAQLPPFARASALTAGRNAAAGAQTNRADGPTGLAPVGLRLRISGLLRCPSGQGEGSIAIVEQLSSDNGTATELNPFAPTAIKADTGWRHFSFADFIPLNRSTYGIESLRVILAGHPWFDVLQYSNYRPHAPIDFKDLQLQFEPVQLLDLDSQHWHVIKSLPQ